MHAKGQKPLSPIFSKSLRVSVLRKITLRVLRVSPKARALATISSLHPFFVLLAITCRSSESLPSLGSNTLALGSCLCDNKSKTRQRQAVVLSSIPPYKPPRKPCDLCVLRVSASLLRTSSHHVDKLRAS